MWSSEKTKQLYDNFTYEKPSIYYKNNLQIIEMLLDYITWV